jgi:hypothetical protein
MKAIAEALRVVVAATVPRLREISEARAGESRGDGKWVAKEILGHLIDSAYNNHQRFVRAPAAAPFVWPGYEQEQWVAANRYRERAWQELIELWEVANRHLAHAIESVPRERLEVPCTIGGEGPETLEWWMRDYLVHMRHHLKQLTAVDS